MDTKLQLELSKKYPILYRYTQEKTKPVVPMAFGFECGNGWYKIIDELSAEIEKYNEKLMATDLPEDEKYPVVAMQVKQKYGGLRFYISGAPDFIHDLVDKAEDESYKTCEICGATEKVTCEGRHWVKTLCEKCRNYK